MMQPGSAAQAILADDIEVRAWSALFDAMPAPMRAHTGARVERVLDAALLLAPGIPVAMFNRAVGLGSREPVTESGIGAVVDAYRRAGARSFIVHSSHATRCDADLTSMLRGAGLEPYAARPAWSKFLRDARPAPVVESSLAVREATPDDADALASALVIAHGLPKEMAAWMRAMTAHPRLRCYALTDGATIVGGGVLFVDGAHAWLGLGGTLPSHRGRGGQSAVMARRVADAIASGATHIATETGEPKGDESNPSWSNIQRAGFDIVASRRNWMVLA